MPAKYIWKRWVVPLPPEFRDEIEYDSDSLSGDETQKQLKNVPHFDHKDTGRPISTASSRMAAYCQSHEEMEPDTYVDLNVRPDRPDTARNHDSTFFLMFETPTTTKRAKKMFDREGETYKALAKPMLTRTSTVAARSVSARPAAHRPSAQSARPLSSPAGPVLGVANGRLTRRRKRAFARKTDFALCDLARRCVDDIHSGTTTPGPGQYTTEYSSSAVRFWDQSIRLHSKIGRQRECTEIDSITPRYPKSHVATPRFGILPEPKPDIKWCPNASTYNPRPVRPRSRACIIDRSKKAADTLEKTLAPGPGHYTPREISRHIPSARVDPGYGGQTSRQPTPGPGAYRLVDKPSRPSSSCAKFSSIPR
eukprot:789899_1